jgi:hypothetical protein
MIFTLSWGLEADDWMVDERKSRICAAWRDFPEEGNPEMVMRAI